MKLSKECREQLIVALAPNFFTPGNFDRISRYKEKLDVYLTAAHAVRESIEKLEVVLLDKNEQ